MYYERRYDKRHNTTMYAYKVEADGKVFRTDTRRKIDYKVEAKKFYAQGYKVIRFTLLGVYVYEE